MLKFTIAEETPTDHAHKDWLVSMLFTFRWETLCVEELDEIAHLAGIE